MIVFDMFTTQWKCDHRAEGASKIRKRDKGALLRFRRPPEIKSNADGCLKVKIDRTKTG